MVLSAFILVIPLLVQPDYWQAKIAGTLFYNPAITRTALDAAAHFGRNFLYAALSHLYAPHETHFVAVSYVDPLSAAFTWIGLACFLQLAFRQRFAAFSLTSFAALLFFSWSAHRTIGSFRRRRGCFCCCHGTPCSRLPG